MLEFDNFRSPDLTICIQFNVFINQLNWSFHSSGFPYEDDRDYDYETDNKEIENDADMNMVKDYPTPTFTTESSNMIVNEGDTVRLPCIVDRLEGFVMLWKRGNEIVTVASQIIDKVRLRRPFTCLFSKQR